MSNPKYVQTELSSEEYRLFESLARDRGLSLTAALQEATEVWIREQQQVDPDDPLFEILDELDCEPLPDEPRTDAAREDDVIEEWSGAESEVQFPEPVDSED